MRNKDTGLLLLYNGLFAISSQYKDLEHLESPIFEVMDEIDSCIVTGFSEQAFENYYRSGIDLEIINELRSFGEFVDKIENQYWTPEHFDQYEDWEIARKWAYKLMKKLGMRRNGWYSSGTNIIYLEK